MNLAGVLPLAAHLCVGCGTGQYNSVPNDRDRSILNWRACSMALTPAHWKCGRQQHALGCSTVVHARPVAPLAQCQPNKGFMLPKDRFRDRHDHRPTKQADVGPATRLVSAHSSSAHGAELSDWALSEDHVEWLQQRPPWSFLPTNIVTAVALVAIPRQISAGSPAAPEAGGLVIVRQGKLVPAPDDAQASGLVRDPRVEVLPGQCLGLEDLMLGAMPHAPGQSQALNRSPGQGLRSGSPDLGLARGNLGFSTGDLGRPQQRAWVAAVDTLLWDVPAKEAASLMRAYLPEFSLALARAAGQALRQSQLQAKASWATSQALAPYIVPAPQQGVVGVSQYAKRLRKNVVEAARDPKRRPVLVFGEPGMGKSNVAALVHFGSTSRAGPMVRLSCSRLGPAGIELFGRGSKPGLLGLLAATPSIPATLLLDNVHLAPPLLVPALRQLVAEGTWRAAPPGSAIVGAAPEPLQVASNVRVILTSERAVPLLEGQCTVIKVPPLRVRPSDIPALASYHLSRASPSVQGVDAAGKGPVHYALSAASLRRLQAYAWPNNETELAAVLERAAVQQAQATQAAQPKGGVQGAGPGAAATGTAEVTPGGAGPPSVELQPIAEELVWMAGMQAKERLRLDLLEVVPGLRRFLRSRLWPNDINFQFTAYAFPVAVALLLWGPQSRELNPVLNVFWDYWWPGIFLVYPFLGRIWCAVCPFMIYGELVQQWRLSQGATLLKWPRQIMDDVGPWSLLGLFAAILVWEEVWDLPHTAALSGWLLILITVGAMVCSALFERRLWCRYLCPIGGMNALFSKGSMTEVRARKGVCSGSCSTYDCYKGSPTGCGTPPDGLEAVGCPLYSHPAQLTDNANCTLCMECLKACPNKSVQVRLRPPLADLWEAGGHQAHAGELALLALLGGAVPLHTAGAVLGAVGGSGALELAQGININHGLMSAVALALPGAAVALADAGGRVWCRAVGQQEPAPLLQLGYGYLPLVWAATLAHYEASLMGEGGKVIQVSVAMVGSYLPDWAAQSLPEAPALVAHPAVIAFVQGGTLLLGASASLALTRRVAAAPWVSIWPHMLCIALYTAEVWALNVN